MYSDKGLYREIFSSHPFTGRPPVIVDIGASGGVSREMISLLRYSVLLVIDGDERDFSLAQSDSRKSLKVVRAENIVIPADDSEADFYLTRNPHCSSTLEPLEGSLQEWVFHDQFEVIEKKRMNARSLSKLLSDNNIQYIDYYKSDTQGTDLRLLDSLDHSLKSSLLRVELEPGIIDAYKGEDKLGHVMTYMDESDFWLSKMVVKGSTRIKRGLFETLSFLERQLIISTVRNSPGWAEVTYIRKYHGELDQRQLLLLWVFSYLDKQYGFALELALIGRERFNDEIYCRLVKFSKRHLLVSFILISPLRFSVRLVRRAISFAR